ncbi:MAG: TRL domain-containing protein [Paludibacter sp.]|nr:TRL domain-containing protein [Paludibacter sp.]MDD3489534.1 TRL domain-containing protein [Paludibacter sp.]
MRKFKGLFFAVALVASAMLSSCAITTPITATSNPVGSKVGTAKSTSILGFFPDGGDLSIQTAAKKGGISKISTVDFKQSMVFLYLVMEYQTIVTGE